MSGLSMSQAGLDDRIREPGLDGQDIIHLRQFTAAEKLLLIIRCPKRNAAAFHGDLPAKTWATKAKTNATGTVRDANGNLMVSDYDMMSLWRYNGTGYAKIYVS